MKCCSFCDRFLAGFDQYYILPVVNFASLQITKKLMHRKKIHTLLATFLFSFNNVFAQEMSPELSAQLTEVLDSMRLELGMKSLSASVRCSVGVTWSDAVGISSVDPAADAAVNDTYGIGSVTKTMMSACLLQLVDEGQLNLSDSIHQWLDTIEYVNPDITIRQLMQHKSGLYDVMANVNLNPTLLSNTNLIWEASDLLDDFLQAPIAAPGGAWSYCNTNYFLLGMIIEAVTGNPYYQEIRTRFLEPLNLTSTAIPSIETTNAPVAHLWLDINGDGNTEDAHDFFYNWNSLNSVAGSAGGYYSTASDMSKWIRTFLRGELHSEEVLDDAMTTVPAPGMNGSTYGLGLMKVNFGGYNGFGHGGDLGYSGQAYYFPAFDLSISVLQNDAEYISWDLLPVVSALLNAMIDTECSVIGVDESTAINANINAFPNPFSDALNITLPASMNGDNINIILFDMTGRVVADEYVNGHEYAGSIRINNLGGLHAGLYMLRCVDDEGGVFTQSVLKN